MSHLSPLLQILDLGVQCSQETVPNRLIFLSHPLHRISIQLIEEQGEASQYGWLCDLDVFHDPHHLLSLIIGGLPLPTESNLEPEDNGNSHHYLLENVAQRDL